MRTYLLDVNVLMGLAWEKHQLHKPAVRWMQSKRRFAWATCALTQGSFVRISSSQGESGPLFADAWDALQLLTKEPAHHFWSLDRGVFEIEPAILERIYGPKQITDALLLDLAIRNGGTLATFDAGIRALFPPGDRYSKYLEILDP
jgi:toxin-antitoxin system PIN domain toxin